MKIDISRYLPNTRKLSDCYGDNKIFTCDCGQMTLQTYLIPISAKNASPLDSLVPSIENKLVCKNCYKKHIRAQKQSKTLTEQEMKNDQRNDY